MSTVRIPAQSTIAASERALWELGEAPIKEALKLPTRVRHLAGGAEASLVQLIVTWAQRSRPRRLETFIASPEDEQIVDFVRRLTGLVAALCADEIAGVSRNVDLTRAVTTAALERLDQLSLRDFRPRQKAKAGTSRHVPHRAGPDRLRLPRSTCGGVVLIMRAPR